MAYLCLTNGEALVVLCDPNSEGTPDRHRANEAQRQLEVVMEGGQAEAPAKGPKSGRGAHVELKDKGQSDRQK